MKKNVGISDQIIRFVLFDLLLGCSYLGIEIPMILAAVTFFGSFYLVLTIIFGYDPFYHLLGISSRYVTPANP